MDKLIQVPSVQLQGNRKQSRSLSIRTTYMFINTNNKLHFIQKN